jgi:hypothetical protein
MSQVAALTIIVRTRGADLRMQGASKPRRWGHPVGEQESGVGNFGRPGVRSDEAGS